MKEQSTEEVFTGWCSGPHEYDYSTIEIFFDDDPVIVVNREKGLDQLEAEVYGPQLDLVMRYRVPLDRLISALMTCREKMLASTWRGVSEFPCSRRVEHHTDGRAKRSS